MSAGLWPACWLDTLDRSSSSAARVVQDVWDVYMEELRVVPAEVVLAIRDAASRSSVDDFWSTWSHNAEAGLFRAYCRAGGPTEAGICYVFVEGVWVVELLAAVVPADCIVSVIVMKWMLVLLSTLFTPLLLRYSPKGIRSCGFTQARWEALLRFWEAVCRHGPHGPICSLHPWDEWAPPDLHGFYTSVFDAVDLLNDFTKQVVVNRRDTGIRN